ncbi:hypothetical protein EJ05DRAFT_476127 [Pseudovirgaria hyperparasitica]|uniref:Zn(2)-C6 fungal-type domain-containing protein n=1 Tax=Pseudovirgaria hyperparasitica TaxID=470096 RepID=A0A6A6WCI3_9PEZI|nr:uncharacterized protein EJ05DRAFT_476127 [Pseudovirgaria hyperparasitica]KAF2758821.1 hypothetical protein EJ05DRAFT_476127 [Pseudovirgaria hyperparasitica]
MDTDLSTQNDEIVFSSTASWSWDGNNDEHDSLSNNGLANQYLPDGQSSKTRNSGPSPPAANRASVSVACVSCRSRHLKCDGGSRCSRCKADGTECSYVKSRRGWKGPRRSRLQHQPNNTGLVSPNPSISRQLPAASEYALVASPSSTLLGITALSGRELVSVNGLRTSESPSTSEQVIPFCHHKATLDEHLSRPAIKQYYDTFAPAHPILPHRELTAELIQRHGLKHLEVAMQYVACRYVFPSESEKLKNELGLLFSNGDPPRDGFTVQTLILFAIGLHANDEPARALEALDMAISIAIEIEMNYARFSTSAGDGDRVLEESWRRTWWQLFVLDAFFAGINKKSDFRLRIVETDVPLPCEEKEFTSCRIPPGHTVDSFESDIFSNTDKCFSSFAYMVHAAKILGSVLQIDPSGATDKVVNQVDTALSAWMLNLPCSKREVMSRSETVDEVLLQAQMIIACANIMLHRPRSALEVDPVGDIKTCVTPGEFVGTTQAREVHTVKAIKAAEDISDLMKLPSPLNKRSPFFTCAVVMASVVHLSYWSFIVPDGEDLPIKDLIRLDTGALRHLSEIWPIAGTCLGQVKGVAQEMFASKKAISLHTWKNMHGEFQHMIDETVSR